VELEKIESSLISHRGYDPAAQIMYIRFADKRFTHGSLYAYGNVPPEMWEQAITWRNDNEKSDAFGDLSMGQWFGRFLKPFDKVHPFRKLEDARNEEGTTTDFSSGQPLPVDAPEPLPEDIEELGAQAIALQEKARTIVINSPEAYSLAETTGIAIARMRDALEKTMRPKIKELYAPYKAALDILNRYDYPLASDQKRLTAGMSAFKRMETARAAEVANAERRRLQDIEDQKARDKAEELKRADIQAAKDLGETKLAKQIEKAPALPVQAAYVPPVPVASAVPQSRGSYHVEDWKHEYVNARGEVVDKPDMTLIPAQYILVDEKTIAAAVKRTKNRTDIPGVRAYDAGAVRLKKK
jgi:hypothetical protein